MGEAFSLAAKAMLLLSEETQKPQRIAVFSGSSSGLGKSHFVHGIFSGLDQEETVEENSTMLPQKTVKLNGSGHVRWYDAAVFWERLPSYQFNNASRYGLPFLDIVEHPQLDKHNRTFDCLVQIGYGIRERMLGRNFVRHIYVVPSTDLLKTPGFQGFLERSHAFARSPQVKLSGFRSEPFTFDYP